jgi:hypothetical protein
MALLFKKKWGGGESEMVVKEEMEMTVFAKGKLLS